MAEQKKNKKQKQKEKRIWNNKIINRADLILKSIFELNATYLPSFQH